MPGNISVSRQEMTSLQSTDAQHEINVMCHAGYDKKHKKIYAIHISQWRKIDDCTQSED